MSKHKQPVVFLPCSGIGHINRGYESFTIQCFDALKDSEDFQLIMFKNAGPVSPNSINIPCIRRSHPFAKFVQKYFKYQAYFVEEISFFIGMLPYLFRHKPDLIFYSDSPLGTLLFNIRKIFKFKYVLLLSNGAPKPPPYKAEDHIQQLLPLYVTRSSKAGVPVSKQTVLQYGVQFNNTSNFPDADSKQELRKKLGLPENKKILISVGAVSSYHKRMDYVVKAFSHLNQDEYFLVILGNIDETSSEITDLAKKLLPPGNSLIKQVPSPEVSPYLLAADYFILASFNEGLPRVLVEALQNGLLPIVHDYDVVRESLDAYGVFGNLADEQALNGLIREVDRLNYDKEVLWQYAYKKYSWQCLRKPYTNMFLNVIQQHTSL